MRLAGAFDGLARRGLHSSRRVLLFTSLCTPGIYYLSLLNRGFFVYFLVCCADKTFSSKFITQEQTKMWWESSSSFISQTWKQDRYIKRSGYLSLHYSCEEASFSRAWPLQHVFCALDKNCAVETRPKMLFGASSMLSAVTRTLARWPQLSCCPRQQGCGHCCRWEESSTSRSWSSRPMNGHVQRVESSRCLVILTLSDSREKRDGCFFVPPNISLVISVSFSPKK